MSSTVLLTVLLMGMKQVYIKNSEIAKRNMCHLNAA